jgi:translation initiation factor IF-2
MYLIIKKIKNNNKTKEIPLRLYENVYNAYEYTEQYMKDSSGKKWHKVIFEPTDINTHFIVKQQWYRELKNGNIESLKIKYLKVYDYKEGN